MTSRSPSGSRLQFAPGVDLSTVSPITLGSDYFQSGVWGPAIGTVIGEAGAEIIRRLPDILTGPGGIIQTGGSRVTQIPTYAMTVRGGHRHHMNYCNLRALRRAMRRVHGFADIAKGAITFTHHVRMKKARKRKCR